MNKTLGGTREREFSDRIFREYKLQFEIYIRTLHQSIINRPENRGFLRIQVFNTIVYSHLMRWW